MFFRRTDFDCMDCGMLGFMLAGASQNEMKNDL